jgi:hypothetical protein
LSTRGTSTLLNVALLSTHYEWHDDWSGPGRAKDTIAMVVKLGLEPGNELNLSRALSQLEISDSDMSPMARFIQEWRERLAAYYRTARNEPSF